MKNKTKIRIIVPANTKGFNDDILDSVSSVIPPDFEVDIKNIEEGNNCIENRYNLMQNTMATIKLVQEAERDGCKGVFVSDFDMCGVDAAREVVNIPVIGGNRASALTAMMLSQKFSIITMMQSVTGMQCEHINRFGMYQNFASIRAINCNVSELSKKNYVANLVFEEALKAIEEDGAQAFIFGCTGFIDIASRVKKLFMTDERYSGPKPVPVLDPNMVALSYLVLLVRNDLLQSRICYNYVDTKPLEENL